MNGGGPACLRLCMYLNGNEIKKIPKQFWASENKIKELTKFINTEYPTSVELKKIQKSPEHFRNIAKKLEKLFQ